MKRIDPLGIMILVITLLAAGSMFFTVGAYSEGNVAVNVSGVMDDNAWGVVGEYEKGIFEVEGNLQSGEAYAGNVDAAVTLFDYFRVSSKNTLKGYELATLGRQNDLGASFVIPIGETVDVAVGIFGRNGNPFTPVYELENPSDPNSAVLKDEGITIQEGSTLLASLEAELDVGRFEIEGQGLLELLGEGDKVQQVRVNISTDGAFFDTGLTWNIAANVRLQKLGEVIEYETDYFAGLGLQF